MSLECSVLYCTVLLGILRGKFKSNLGLHLRDLKIDGLSGRMNVRKFKNIILMKMYRGADKSSALPGRKQATATENFEFHISYL